MVGTKAEEHARSTPSAKGCPSRPATHFASVVSRCQSCGAMLWSPSVKLSCVRPVSMPMFWKSGRSVPGQGRRVCGALSTK